MVVPCGSSSLTCAEDHGATLAHPSNHFPAPRKHRAAPLSTARPLPRVHALRPRRPLHGVTVADGYLRGDKRGERSAAWSGQAAQVPRERRHAQPKRPRCMLRVGLACLRVLAGRGSLVCVRTVCASGRSARSPPRRVGSPRPHTLKSSAGRSVGGAAVRSDVHSRVQKLCMHA